MLPGRVWRARFLVSSIPPGRAAGRMAEAAPRFELARGALARRTAAL